ncbi:hypothetical protein E0Z10_g8858 [Xylaria hypoxylon]|uniref:Major facilitator superfamily (MFS) profile domain-containing protein n=1 Tax=Xylaria hypoxylon TaxID=37992 RepID=A0A4Z0YKJ8_9PEZI|nr:hypothetical protein E0Z10_g8858 [Xylaria hypoxylon]
MGSYFSALRARNRRVVFEIQYVSNTDPQDPDAAIQSVIDRRGLDGFQWRVWWVAASGFFTTSYSIFAVNVISPILAYVYPDPDCSPGWPGSSLIINLTTLVGTIVGAIVFGFLADRHGRKSVYGLELAIVIVATIGITTASTGVSNSMNVYGWILFWRTLLGIGLGAEYPLSSIIAAEWSSTKSRGRMMAAVFLMQSVGQLAAYGFGLAILVGVSKRLGLSPGETDRAIAVPKVDVIWRAIIGVGAFPALVSLVLRRTIPETPYYLVETGRVTDAVTAARQVYAPEVTLQPTGQDALSPMQTVLDGLADKAEKPKGSWWANTREYIREVREHLSQKSRWRTLLGVMLTWWLLDLAYFNGGTFFIAFESDKHGLTIILYVLAQVIFNLGPNTMTFILPAELFATKFRGTFYGLAAASGKLGAITILLIINFGVYEGKAFLPSGSAFAKTLLGFAPAMLLGAFITWVWIPEVQFPRGHESETTRDENTSDDGLDPDLQDNAFRKKLKLPNRPLAHIALDPEGGQVLGVRRNLRRLIQRVRGGRKRGSVASMLESGTDEASGTVNSSGAQYLMHPQPFDGHEVDLDSGDLGTMAPAGRTIITTAESQPSMGTTNDHGNGRHLLGKKSWNVYNPANIERVKRDEAEARARAEAEEKRQQDLEAERRLAILRGEIPPAPPTPPSPVLSTEPSSARRKREHDDDPTAQFRGGERRKRKRFGEDDTDFEMRVARERTDTAATSMAARLSSSTKTSNAPLVDSKGHISLFPEEEKGRETTGNEKNEDAEREAAKKRREFEDQYTMRFSNAAGRDGAGVTSSGPWYASNGATDSREPAEAQTPGKNVWGHDDPKRKARDAARVVSNDPLAMMKRGAAKMRDVERERRTLNEEKAKELKQLRKEEKRHEKRRKHHDVDELEGFSLDARHVDVEDGKHEHRSGSRSRDGRDKHRHFRSSDHDDYRERRHRHHKDYHHEGGSDKSHSRMDREDGEKRHSSGHSRRQLAKTDHY